MSISRYCLGKKLNPSYAKPKVTLPSPHGDALASSSKVGTTCPPRAPFVSITNGTVELRRGFAQKPYDERKPEATVAEMAL